MSRAPEPREHSADHPVNGTDRTPVPPADGPATEPGAEKRDERERHHIDPARMEVRVRRTALLGLVLVPLVYFIAQSLG